ncbi:MAG: hypothetical protein E6Q66_01400 [Pedobacter sp.]|nr:MAG: hypothetical protein E6Q66_01400 [Pedobacter sp.]
MQQPDFSKESILGRMLNSAADLWGIKHNDNLEPVVRLLMEAFAAEIFKVQQNIEVSNARLVEYLADTLTPTKLTAVVPAHAVMHASCSPTTQLIDETTLYEVAGIGAQKDQKFSFTPIDNILLYHAEVTDLITASNACKVDGCIYKVVTTTPTAGSISQNYVWLGVSISNQLHDIKGLSFFVEWPNLGSRNDLYRSMTMSKWTIDGEMPLQMSQGLVYADTSYENDPIKRLETYSLVANDIKNSYQSQFFTVSSSIAELQKYVEGYPAIFKDYFSEEQLGQFFTEKKLWLRIELPVYLEADILGDMLINTNCFPVVNRELKLATTNTGLIPLVCDSTERLLCEGSVYGTISGSYHRTELRESGEEVNTYTLRKSGLERFDRRDAYNLVKDVELLVKNEVQAFAALNGGNNQELIDVLNAVVDQTKRNYKNEEDKASKYIILKKEVPSEVVTAEFWVTKCENANQIRMGTVVQNIQDSSQVGCVLLTSTRGGRDTQDESEKIRAYQYVLLTKEQIVSAQDIKSFIHYQLGENVSQVEVKSGLMIGKGTKQGLVRSIDIYIHTTDNFKEDTVQWGDVLLQKLQQQSDPSRIYRLFWNGLS